MELLVSLYLKAEAGDAVAQFNLGVLYDTGDGIPQNRNEAAKWYSKAAEQGLAVAQHNLALMYLKGEGVPLNYVLAYKWCNLAASQGYDFGITLREYMTEQLSPEQIDEGQRLSREYREKSTGNRDMLRVMSSRQANYGES
jgi:TPR repeat protein